MGKEEAGGIEEPATKLEPGPAALEPAAAALEAAAAALVAAAPPTTIVPHIPLATWTRQKKPAVPAVLKAGVVKVHAAERHGFTSNVTPNAAPATAFCASDAVAADVTVWNPEFHWNVI